jgi:hypothetical protein
MDRLLHNRGIQTYGELHQIIFTDMTRRPAEQGKETTDNFEGRPKDDRGLLAQLFVQTAGDGKKSLYTQNAQ